MLAGNSFGFEIFSGIAKAIYSIKPRFLDFANAHAYKFIRLMHGKRGENPPLPRNCNRRELSVVATEGCTTWEGCSKLVDARVRRPIRPQSFGLFRLRWESRTASDIFWTAICKLTLYPYSLNWTGVPFQLRKEADLITLVLGGVRSGKSRYAQMLAMRAKEVVFLATAQPSDDEMRAKIARHRQERPANWETVEVPFDLDVAIAEQGVKYSFLLIDCLTTFTTNLLMAEGDNCEELLARVDRVCSAIQATPASVALVSNEVGSGIVPAFPLGRQFRDLLGEVNQKVARISDNVILMIAGCPLAIKGIAEVQP